MKQPFVTLTLYTGKQVTVNMDHVVEIAVNEDGETVLAEAGSRGCLWRVKESPAAILMQLEQQNSFADPQNPFPKTPCCGPS